MNFQGGGGMKRPSSGEDYGHSGGKKDPMQVMKMVIQNSQKDLQMKTSGGLPQDPEQLKQIFTRQQMLLELQTEMMSQMSSNDDTPAAPAKKEEAISYPSMAKRPNMPKEDFYFGFNKPNSDSQHQPARRFNEEVNRRGGGAGPEPLMTKGMSMRPGINRVGMGPDRFEMERIEMDRMRRFEEERMQMERMQMERMRMNQMGPGFDMDRMGPMDRGGPMRGRPDFDQRNRGGRNMRDNGRDNGRDKKDILGRNIPSDHKGRGVPATREEAWDFHGVPGNPLNRPYQNSPPEDKVTIFKREIFKYDNFPQPLKLIETARHNYLEGRLKTAYCQEEVEGTEDFIGYLNLNGVLMAVERGSNAVDAKVKTYGKAVYLLSTKPLSYIFINANELHHEHTHPQLSKKTLSFVSDRLTWVVRALSDAIHNIPRANPHKEFEDFILGENLSVTGILKRKLPKGYTSDLYIDDIFVASGNGMDKFDAHKDAFTNARDVLYKEKNLQRFLIKENRLSSIDFFDPEIVDIKHSEFKHRVYTNIETLSIKGMYNRDLLKKKENIIGIIPMGETSDWKCLDETAAANNLLMEYNENSSGTSARCTVFLQGQIYADSYSSKEDSSRSMAMSRAKFVLLKRCTQFIQKQKVDFSNVALTFEQIVEKAGELSMSQPDLLTDKETPEYQSQGKDPAPNDLSPWVDEFLKDLVYNYGQTEGLDDLIIVDLPSYHSKILTDQADLLNVCVENERFKNRPYSIVMKAVTKNLASDEFVKYLKDHGGESGRYKLTEKEAHVASDLMPKPNKYLMGVQVVNHDAPR